MLPKINKINLLKPSSYSMYHKSKQSKILHSFRRIFISFVRVSGEISKFSLYSTQRHAFITVEASVFCAVRHGHLNKVNYVSSLNV